MPQSNAIPKEVLCILYSFLALIMVASAACSYNSSEELQNQAQVAVPTPDVSPIKTEDIPLHMVRNVYACAVIQRIVEPEKQEIANVLNTRWVSSSEDFPNGATLTPGQEVEKDTYWLSTMQSYFSEYYREIHLLVPEMIDHCDHLWGICLWMQPEQMTDSPAMNRICTNLRLLSLPGPGSKVFWP